MFAWLKADPSKKLQKKHDKLFEQAFQAQRNGDIALYSKLSQECDILQKRIDDLKRKK